MDTMSYLLGKNASSGGGGSSTNVYEVTIDPNTLNITGTLPANLTANNLINSFINIVDRRTDEQTQEEITIMNLCQIINVTTLSQEPETLYLEFWFGGSSASLSYTLATGEVKRGEW